MWALCRNQRQGSNVSSDIPNGQSFLSINDVSTNNRSLFLPLANVLCASKCRKPPLSDLIALNRRTNRRACSRLPHLVQQGQPQCNADDVLRGEEWKRSPIAGCTVISSFCATLTTSRQPSDTTPTRSYQSARIPSVASRWLNPGANCQSARIPSVASRW